MDALAALLLAWLAALAINFMPAMMPPTWAVLAVVHATTDAPLLPLTIGGAAMSAVGRAVLAKASGGLRRFVPEGDRKNAEALAAFVDRHRRWRSAIVFFYCLGPFPSNPLFVAAGIGRMRLRPVTIAFFLARAIGDTFWVWTAGTVAGSLERQFTGRLTDWRFIAAQVVTAGAVVLALRLPWARWLGMTGGACDEGDGAERVEPEAGAAYDARSACRRSSRTPS